MSRPVVGPTRETAQPPRPVGESAAAAVRGGRAAEVCDHRRPASGRSRGMTGYYSTTLRSLLAVPSVALLMASGVAPSVSAVATASGVASGLPAR